MALLDLPHSHDYFAEMFHSLGIQPTVRFRSTSAGTCRAIAARGLAYTLLNAKPQGVGKDEARRVVRDRLRKGSIRSMFEAGQ
ncbi:hypothetical protein ACFVTY_32890 [Streptomyces sp. NPDC058067]|uniref:hypothetical protein n=1 Tax=Streptomyces sp. NPDC058067 TaxID=3346324 RepID=UPI0036EAB2E8